MFLIDLIKGGVCGSNLVGRGYGVVVSRCGSMGYFGRIS